MHRPQPSDRAVLLVLGSLVALGPLATDAYVPALPRLAASLGSDAGHAQLTVTATLLGLGAGQLVAGPWSDAVGRRPPILAGVGLYAVGAVLSATAPDLVLLVVGRVLQGLGGAFALVVAYAYVRDRFVGSASVRAFAALLLVAGAGPVVAPLAGGYLAVRAGWRSVFVALGVASLLAGVGAALLLPETRRRATPGTRTRVWPTYRRLVRDPVFVQTVAANAAAFAAMFVYIAASPFVLEQTYGLSVGRYSVVFAVNASGLVTTAQVSGRLAREVGAPRLLDAGVAALLVGAVLIAASAALVPGQLWGMLVGMFVLVSSVGLVLPNAATLALEPHAGDAGAASAVIGAGQYLLGALAAAVVGLAAGNLAPTVAMAVVVLVLSAAAAALTLARRHRSTP